MEKLKNERELIFSKGLSKDHSDKLLKILKSEIKNIPPGQISTKKPYISFLQEQMGIIQTREMLKSVNVKELKSEIRNVVKLQKESVIKRDKILQKLEIQKEKVAGVRNKVTSLKREDFAEKAKKTNLLESKKELTKNLRVLSNKYKKLKAPTVERTASYKRVKRSLEEKITRVANNIKKQNKKIEVLKKDIFNQNQFLKRDVKEYSTLFKDQRNLEVRKTLYENQEKFFINRLLLKNRYAKDKNPLETLLAISGEKSQFEPGKTRNLVQKAFNKFYSKISSFENNVAKDLTGTDYLKNLKFDSSMNQNLEKVMIRSLKASERLNYRLGRDIFMATIGATGTYGAAAGLGATSITPFGLAALAGGGGLALGIRSILRRGQNFLPLARKIDKMHDFMEKASNVLGVKSLLKNPSSLEKETGITYEQLFFMMTGKKISEGYFNENNDISNYGENDHYIHDGKMSSLLENEIGIEKSNEYNMKNLKTKKIIASLAPKGFRDQFGDYHPPSELKMDEFMTTVNQGLSFPQFVKSVREQTLTVSGFNLAKEIYPTHLNRFNIALTQGLQEKKIDYGDSSWYLQFIENLNSNKANLLYTALDMQQREESGETGRKLKRQPLYDHFTGTEA